MKIVVSSIMKDEPPEFVERWAKSSLDADEMVLVDTGSTNDAVTCARDLGVMVHEIAVRPWRFDVARNTALALLPADADLVVKVDVDEVLLSGWRDVIESAPPADRYSYEYIWNHTPDGKPDVVFSADHTHTRFNWQWRHPVHEALHFTGKGDPLTVHLPFTIEHLADETKPRSQYLPLLEQATKEAPDDDRMAHYYARELFFRGDWTSARAEFMRHLSLPSAVWPAERAQSYRYLAKMDDYPERWLLKAVAEAPDRREPWVDLVDLWLGRNDPVQAAGYAARALAIRGRTGDYMSEAHAWDDFALRKTATGTG
jgi:hypothetical protein